MQVKAGTGVGTGPWSEQLWQALSSRCPQVAVDLGHEGWGPEATSPAKAPSSCSSALGGGAGQAAVGGHPPPGTRDKPPGFMGPTALALQAGDEGWLPPWWPVLCRARFPGLSLAPAVIGTSSGTVLGVCHHVTAPRSPTSLSQQMRKQVHIRELRPCKRRVSLVPGPHCIPCA